MVQRSVRKKLANGGDDLQTRLGVGACALIVACGSSNDTGAAIRSATWSLASPGTSPSTRLFAAMSYDSTRQKVIMFGGYGPSGCDGSDPGSNYCGATWEYDGVTWRQATPTSSPSPRQFPAMAYDSDRRLVVLFGGAHYPVGGCEGGNAYACGGTWEYNGMTWVQRQTFGPSARDGATMVYDSQRKKMVLFGGETPQVGCDDSSANLCGGTWEYDGTTWTRIQQATHPLPRVGAAMAYDTNRGKVVLFGGSVISAPNRTCDSSGSGYCDGTWQYDGNSWTQFRGQGPSARWVSAMVYVPDWKRIVLFGGSHGDGINPLGETWSFDGSTWTQLSPSASPLPRAGQAMAYDSGRGRIVLFGGVTPDGLRDTWEFH